MPIFFQLNKQDLPGALDPELLKKMLEVDSDVVIPTSAINGTGVFNILKAATKTCLEKLSS